MPASHRSLTGWRAISAYSTSTTDGGIRMPSDDPPWMMPTTSRLS